MKTAPITIQRGGGDMPNRTESFDVPYSEGMSVLDALIWIRNNADPSLAFRHSCINANACKECVMRIDGRTVYACTTAVHSGEMLIEPLPNKQLIRDLVTDTLPPDERLVKP